MTAKEIQVLIERYIAAYNAFDVEGMMALMHPDVLFRNVAGGTVTAEADGIGALRVLAVQSKGLFASRRQEIANLSIEGDRASASVDFEGVLALDVPGGPKAGDTLSLSGRSEFEFRDGLFYRIIDIS
ncbi:MAG: nuclear transport factor 2 family protein [Syntrophales bacterium]